MSRRSSMLAVAAVAGLAFGCTGLKGRWQYQTINPAGAERHLPIRCVDFTTDRDFSAEVLRGGRLERVSGTYIWDAKSHQVVLTTPEGEQLYRADVCGPCSTLQFWSPDDPERWRATFVTREGNAACSTQPVKK